MRKNDAKRFRANVRLDKSTGCWLWTGRVDHRGYARFYSRSLKREIPAHYYTLMKAGRPVPKDRETHHKCGTRNCVNPDHIKTLTHAEHMRIHAKSGIWAGEKNSQSRYSDVEVMSIKILHRVMQIPGTWLVDKMGIPERSIYYVGSAKGWKHIEPLLQQFVDQHVRAVE